MLPCSQAQNSGAQYFPCLSLASLFGLALCCKRTLATSSANFESPCQQATNNGLTWMWRWNLDSAWMLCFSSIFHYFAHSDIQNILWKLKHLINDSWYASLPSNNLHFRSRPCYNPGWWNILQALAVLPQAQRTTICPRVPQSPFGEADYLPSDSILETWNLKVV